MADYISIILIVLFTFLALSTRSYIMLGMLTFSIIGLNTGYGAGGFSSFLSIVYLLIIWHFTRKRKKHLREEKWVYQEGQESARWAKIFNRGYDEEYYK